jgi:hypothetical protein
VLVAPTITVYEVPGVTAILFAYAKAPPPPPSPPGKDPGDLLPPAPTHTTETLVTPAGAVHE